MRNVSLHSAGQVAKEKALQLERKKKAAQFLAQLAEKKTGVSSVTAVEGEPSSGEEGELLVERGAEPADSNVSEGRTEMEQRYYCDTVTVTSLLSCQDSALDINWQSSTRAGCTRVSRLLNYLLSPL